MPETQSPFDPNSHTALFATILERVGEVKEGQAAMRRDFADQQKRVFDRLDTHAAQITVLETSDAVRARQVKWAVTAIAVIGWGVNALISWKAVKS